MEDRYIAGHGDVRDQGGTFIDTSGDRRVCPGIFFPWHTYEKAGLSLPMDNSFTEYDTMYGGFFALHPDGVMKEGDRDGSLRYGGKKHHRATFRRADTDAEIQIQQVQESQTELGKYHLRGSPEVAVKVEDPAAPSSRPGPMLGPAVRELQSDLRRIGYAVPLSGEYDGHTAVAVERAKMRWVLAPLDIKDRPSKVSENLDKATATAIKAVISELIQRGDTRSFG